MSVHPWQRPRCRCITELGRRTGTADCRHHSSFQPTTNIFQMSSTIAMSTLPRMRIIAVPLTRPRISPVPGKLARLTYYQFQQFPTSTKAVESKGGWLPREGVVNWLTNKGESVWNGFGKSPGGWKVGLSRAPNTQADDNSSKYTKWARVLSTG